MKEEIRNSVDLFMKQLDTKRTGYVNETQFVTNTLRLYPEEELKRLLNIDLIPSELLNETNMNASVAGSRLNMSRRDVNKTNSIHRSSSQPQALQQMSIELDNETLEMVASKAIKKDWEKFSIKLGFLEYDIKEFKSRHNGKAYDTVRNIYIFKFYYLLFRFRFYFLIKNKLLDILTQWRDQDPYLATRSRLRRYLDDSNMTEASSLL